MHGWSKVSFEKNIVVVTIKEYLYCKNLYTIKVNSIKKISRNSKLSDRHMLVFTKIRLEIFFNIY